MVMAYSDREAGVVESCGHLVGVSCTSVVVLIVEVVRLVVVEVVGSRRMYEH